MHPGSPAPQNQRQQALQEAFAGRLQIGPLLDRGGVAEVYLVHRLDGLPPETPATMALKVLRPLLSLDDDIAAMFHDEIRVMQGLSHDHVVRCIDGDPTHKPPYLLLEYIPGCNLAHLMQQRIMTPLPWPVVWEIATAMAAALAYLHTAKSPEGTPLQLIHRDMSPPNVLLGLQGEVRLTDFGISIWRNMARDTSGEDPKGKFSYLAPEMLQGIAVDQRADLFSWGIIVWELLTGHRLFEANAPEETLELLRSAPILAPRHLEPETPPSLERVVMCALARDREQRPANAASLLQALQAIERPAPLVQRTLADIMGELAAIGQLPHVAPTTPNHM